MKINADVRISGMGVYHPRNKVLSVDLDKKFDAPKGYCQSITGVESRYFVDGETSKEMAASAAKDAMNQAGLQLSDIDAIVSVSSVPEQPIPCLAALIQKEMEGGLSSIPCWDINATCLGFVTALDLLSITIQSGRYNRILVVSCEMASKGIDWDDLHCAALFGDAGVAAIIEKSPPNQNSKVLVSHMETYSDFSDLCVVEGGGTKIWGTMHSEENHRAFLFKMNGRKVFRNALHYLPGFFDRAFEGTGLSMQDMDLVIPHHAAKSALDIIRRKLGIPEEKWFHTLSEYGNTISASVPCSLHAAIERGVLQRGQKALLLGSGAGLAFGTVVFQY